MNNTQELLSEECASWVQEINYIISYQIQDESSIQAAIWTQGFPDKKKSCVVIMFGGPIQRCW